MSRLVIGLLMFFLLATLFQERNGQECVESVFATLDTSVMRLPTVLEGSISLFDVPFACSGRIRSWKGLGQYVNGNTNPSQFQIWRRLSSDLLQLVASVSTTRGRRISRIFGIEEIDATLDSDNPVYVQKGDIVGVYAPPGSLHLLQAEENMEANGLGTTHFITSINTALCTLETCYQEVYNVSRKYIPRFEISVDSQDASGQMSAPSCQPWLFEPCAMPPTTTPPTDPTDPTESGDASSSAGGIAAGIVVSLVVIAVIAAIVVIAVIVIWKVKKDRGLYFMNDRAANTNDDGYATIRAPEKGRTLDRATEPVYAPVDHRDTRGASQHYEFDSSPVPNPMYRPSFSRQLHSGTNGVNRAKQNEGDDDIKRPYAILDGPSPTHESSAPVPPYAVPLIHGDPMRSSVEVRSFHGTLKDSQGEPHYATLMSGRSDTDSQYWQPSDNETEIYARLQESKYLEIKPQSLKLGKFIGSGQFALVHKGVWVSSAGSVDVAVKQLKDNVTEKDRVKFLQEAAIMGQFTHPGIVMMFGVVKEVKPMIILEYLPRGDLRHYLTTIKPRNTSTTKGLAKTLLKFCRQISSGMNYLSFKGFVHRDLAARNILVTDEGECKIADFGLSRDLAEENYYFMKGGRIPLKWTAPEALHYRKYSTKSDVWSFGVVLFEIWSLGKKPFASLSNPDAFQRVVEGIRLPPPPGCPRGIYKLMILCWHPEASQRPSFATVVDYLAKPDTTLLSWQNKDQGNPPEAYTLGKPLEAGSCLYHDLQETYLNMKSSASEYEVPSDCL